MIETTLLPPTKTRTMKPTKMRTITLQIHGELEALAGLYMIPPKMTITTTTVQVFAKPRALNLVSVPLRIAPRQSLLARMTR